MLCGNERCRMSTALEGVVVPSPDQCRFRHPRTCVVTQVIVAPLHPVAGRTPRGGGCALLSLGVYFFAAHPDLANLAQSKPVVPSP